MGKSVPSAFDSGKAASKKLGGSNSKIKGSDNAYGFSKVKTSLGEVKPSVPKKPKKTNDSAGFLTQLKQRRK